jgi:hypothetical protein
MLLLQLQFGFPFFVCCVLQGVRGMSLLRVLML